MRGQLLRPHTLCPSAGKGGRRRQTATAGTCLPGRRHFPRDGHSVRGFSRLLASDKGKAKNGRSDLIGWFEGVQCRGRGTQGRRHGTRIRHNPAREGGRNTDAEAEASGESEWRHERSGRRRRGDHREDAIPEESNVLGGGKPISDHPITAQLSLSTCKLLGKGGSAAAADQSADDVLSGGSGTGNYAADLVAPAYERVALKRPAFHR